LQATLFFLYRYLDNRIGNPNARILPPLINEFTGVLLGWLCFLVVLLPVLRRVRWDWQHWARSLAVYAGAMIAFSLLHTTLIWSARSAMYPLLGLGVYRYGRMPWPYAMEFPIDAIAVVLCVIVYHLLRTQREARDNAIRAAQAEQALSGAQLRALQNNLQPHFLFNALNTIASRVHDDPAEADAMITNLSELLRATLRQRNAERLPLRDELELLGHYTSLLKARFGARCRIELQIADEVRDALVPALVLQPLVENAVRHGNLARIGEGHIRVDIRRVGDEIEVLVEDDGPGTTGDPLSGEGLGLKSTAERLRLMYPNRHTFVAENRSGGFSV
jgi:signal transduction histidine kinase